MQNAKNWKSTVLIRSFWSDDVNQGQTSKNHVLLTRSSLSQLKKRFQEDKRLVLMASDHVVSGVDLYRGELQLMTISHFIAQNLLLIYLCIVDSSASLFE